MFSEAASKPIRWSPSASSGRLNDRIDAGYSQAGAGYLPIDPSYPVERIKMILEDAAPSVILTQQALATNLQQTAVRSSASTRVGIDRREDASG